MGIDSLFQVAAGQSTLYDLLKNFLSTSNIELKSDLSPDQIAIICEISWHNAINDPQNFNRRGMDILMDVVVTKLLELSVSKDRKSRAEMENIFRALFPKENHNTPEDQPKI